MKIKGRLAVILPVVRGTKKDGGEWSKIEFVVKEDREYGDEVFITAFGDKIEKVQALKINSMVDVTFNSRVREYNGKYFKSNIMYSIEQEGKQRTQQPRPTEQKHTDQPATAFGADSDGLPF